MFRVSPAGRESLLRIARASIREALGEGAPLARLLAATEITTELVRRCGAFVSLKKPAATGEGRDLLRGCIGTMISGRPLYRNVIDLAPRAALQRHGMRGAHRRADAAAYASHLIHHAHLIRHRERTELTALHAVPASDAGLSVHCGAEVGLGNGCRHSELGYTAQDPAGTGAAVADIVVALHVVPGRMKQARLLGLGEEPGGLIAPFGLRRFRARLEAPPLPEGRCARACALAAHLVAAAPRFDPVREPGVSRPEHL